MIAMGIIATASVAYIAVTTYQSRNAKQPYYARMAGRYCHDKYGINLKDDGTFEGWPESISEVQDQRREIEKIKTLPWNEQDNQSKADENALEIRIALSDAVNQGEWQMDSQTVTLLDNKYGEKDKRINLEVESNRLLDTSTGLYYEKC